MKIPTEKNMLFVYKTESLLNLLIQTVFEL